MFFSETRCKMMFLVECSVLEVWHHTPQNGVLFSFWLVDLSLVDSWPWLSNGGNILSLMMTILFYCLMHII